LYFNKIKEKLIKKCIILDHNTIDKNENFYKNNDVNDTNLITVNDQNFLDFIEQLNSQKYN